MSDQPHRDLWYVRYAFKCFELGVPFRKWSGQSSSSADSPQRFEGKSRIKGSITLAVLTYGLGLLRTGGDVTLPEGTGLLARVVD